MSQLLDYPRIFFLVAFLVLWFAARFGAYCSKRRRQLQEDEREDFGIILAATLTLLGLIIGFSFSMAISRYDQRKTYEEAEANAIGTEYVRAGLLPTADAARARQLLKDYLDQRILFYHSRAADERTQVNTRTTQLQNQLWSAVQTPAALQPTPVVALVLSGMNDVLNSQGYTQAAWWNRIPTAAWILMVLIAICCNLLIGFGARHEHSVLFLIVPLVVSLSFFLIADIDSPVRGLIRVTSQNLDSLSQSLKSP
jgi:hypothetical protein